MHNPTFSSRGRLSGTRCSLSTCVHGSELYAGAFVCVLVCVCVCVCARVCVVVVVVVCVCVCVCVCELLLCMCCVCVCVRACVCVCVWVVKRYIFFDLQEHCLPVYFFLGAYNFINFIEQNREFAVRECVGKCYRTSS